jgi:phage regulator Rha-like protein
MISERINHESSDGYLIPVASAAPIQAAIPIHWLGDTPAVDSRVLAEGFDNRHKNVLALTRKYQPLIESRLGPIIKKTLVQRESAHNAPNLSLPVKRSTKPQTIFLLTEEQALFLGALCRNSERVVSFKMTLITAFAQARRQRAPAMPAIDVARLVEYEQRLSDLERQLDQYRANQQQAAQLLLNVDRSSEAVPEETMRIKIQRIVNGYCQAKGQMQSFVWSHVYEILYTRYRVRIQAYKKGKRETLLSVAERIGQLSNVYAIVSSELRY